jgi:hypothetical protein
MPPQFRGSPVQYGYGIFQSYCRIAGRRVATAQRYRAAVDALIPAPTSPPSR